MWRCSCKKGGICGGVPVRREGFVEHVYQQHIFLNTKSIVQNRDEIQIFQFKIPTKSVRMCGFSSRFSVHPSARSCKISPCHDLNTSQNTQKHPKLSNLLHCIQCMLRDDDEVLAVYVVCCRVLVVMMMRC